MKNLTQQIKKLLIDNEKGSIYNKNLLNNVLSIYF